MFKFPLFPSTVCLHTAQYKSLLIAMETSSELMGSTRRVLSIQAWSPKKDQEISDQRSSAIVSVGQNVFISKPTQLEQKKTCMSELHNSKWGGVGQSIGCKVLIFARIPAIVTEWSIIGKNKSMVVKPQQHSSWPACPMGKGLGSTVGMVTKITKTIHQLADVQCRHEMLQNGMLSRL